MMPVVLEHHRRGAYDPHFRANGEVLALLADRVDHARRKGVKLGKPAFGVTP
jgi:hypothetical protein